MQKPRCTRAAAYWCAYFGTCLALLAGPLPNALAAEIDDLEVTQLLEMSLEELLDVEVTSVSKRQEQKFKSPAAAHVITREDIRRMGARTIPEALRGAPGLEVARIDGNKWAVTARGFNGRFANKLLVLVDGESVYNPIFSGTYWDALDIPMEEIEQIEVIRGPGGTTWGANAVNGVINVITRRAEGSEQMFVSAGGGTRDRAYAIARFRERINDRASLSVYATGFDRRGELPTTSNFSDQWQSGRGGARLDWEPAQGQRLLVKGTFYKGRSGQVVSVPIPGPPYASVIQDEAEISGGTALARWERSPSARSEYAVQAYYQVDQRQEAVGSAQIQTIDIDAQHQLHAGAHELIWGGGYRVISDRLSGDVGLTFRDPERSEYLLSAFVQDAISWSPGLVTVFGAKVEQHLRTGFNVQPGMRVRWTPTGTQTIWGSVAHAVRTPSRGELDATYPVGASPDPSGSGLPLVTTFFGQPELGNESMTAFELGYRVQPSERVHLDATGFYNRYSDLAGLRPGTPFLDATTVPQLILPLVINNDFTGQTTGFELVADARPLHRWRVRVAYAHLDMKLEPKDPTTGSIAPVVGSSPSNQAYAQTWFDVAPRVQVSGMLRYVGGLERYSVPAFTELDLRVGWQALSRLELSVVGTDLLTPEHREFGSDFGYVATPIRRAVYAALTYRN